MIINIRTHWTPITACVCVGVYSVSIFCEYNITKGLIASCSPVGYPKAIKISKCN